MSSNRINPGQANAGENGLLLLASRIREADRFKDTSLMIHKAGQKSSQQKLMLKQTPQTRGNSMNGHKVNESVTCLIL
jgi:hypothetical protein